MTELEKIAYTKTFIDKLANGINPLDDTQIPEGEVAANPRMAKCFLYVSQILSDIIEHPSAIDEMHRVKGWSVTPEVQTKIECTQAYVSISAFAKKIDEALCSTRKFTAAELNPWLVENGYLNYVKLSDDKTTRRPTQKGNEIGIVLVDDVSENGHRRYVVRCDINAQKFIRDRLPEIVEYSRTRGNNSELQRKRVVGISYAITQAELLKFPFSQAPVTVRQIADNFNSLRTLEGSGKLKATDLTDWLVGMGILEIVQLGGKNNKMPSDVGREIGISVERRQGADGEYCVALYDLEAQRFIVDNIHALVKVI